MKSRLVADIDDKVKEAVAIFAIQNKTTINEVTEKALINYLGIKAEKKETENNNTIEIA